MTKTWTLLHVVIADSITAPLRCANLTAVSVLTLTEVSGLHILAVIAVVNQSRRWPPVEQVSVLVTRDIGDECLERIIAVSPRIKLRDASDFASAERRGELANKEQFDALLAEAEVLYGVRLPKNVITRAPGLRWLQMMSAGVDRFLHDDIVGSAVTMTNVSGIHVTSIGEFVLGLMLMFVKRSAFCFHSKQEKRWERFNPGELHSKTVGIVGLGHLGREVARLAKAFGMRVVATRRSARQATRARHVDMVLPPGQLSQLLSASDFVVLAVPLTAETRRLIGETELRAMKSTAYLINVGRGGIVDEDVLVRALDERWIAGAGLDVFTTEPLPADSRLWELPNVLLSPHVSGAMEDYGARAADVFCQNLKRYLNGKKLINVVDKRKGY